MSCSVCQGSCPENYSLDGCSAPAHNWETTESMLRLTWFPSSDTTKIARWIIATDDGVVTLDHITILHTRVAGETSSSHLSEPPLGEIPEPLLSALRGAGYVPAEKGGVSQ